MYLCIFHTIPLDWNICIMKDVLAPLYAALLVKLHAKAQLSAHTDWNRSAGTGKIRKYGYVNNMLIYSMVLLHWTQNQLPITCFNSYSFLVFTEFNLSSIPILFFTTCSRAVDPTSELLPAAFASKVAHFVALPSAA